MQRPRASIQAPAPRVVPALSAASAALTAAAGTPMKAVCGAWTALLAEARAIKDEEKHRSAERDAYNKVRFYRQRLRELEKDARMSRRRVEQLVQIRDQHLAAVALASCEAADARARGDQVLRPPREPPSKAVVQAAENEVVDAQTLAAFRDEKVAEAKQQLQDADAQLQASKELASTRRERRHERPRRSRRRSRGTRRSARRCERGRGRRRLAGGSRR